MRRTLRDVCDDFFQGRAAPFRQTKSRTPYERLLWAWEQHTAAPAIADQADLYGASIQLRDYWTAHPPPRAADGGTYARGQLKLLARPLLAHALARGWLSRLPALCQLPRARAVRQNQAHRWISYAAVLQTYEACRWATWPRVGHMAADLWRALLSVLTDTGIRISQANRLTWEMVRLRPGESQAVRYAMPALDLPPECNKSNAWEWHPLSTRSVRDLLKLRTPAGRVFPLFDEARENKRPLYRQLDRLQQLAGAAQLQRPWRFHDIRRLFVSDVYFLGDDAEEVARRMTGHASARTTRRYIDYVAAQERDAQRLFQFRQEQEGLRCTSIN